MATDSEWAVLGGLLLDPSRIQDVDLEPRDFASTQHREIYAAILEADAAGEAVDAITVAERLQRKTGKDWLETVAGIVKETASAKNVKSYAQTVRQASRQRCAVEIADTLKESIHRDGEAAVDEAVRQLMELNLSRRQYAWSMQEVMSGAVELLDEYNNAQGIVGVPSGLADLDERMGGFRNSDLTVIGARPAMGKTALLLNFALAPDVPVGIISAEQPRDQIGMRCIAIDGRVSAHSMRLAQMSDGQWAKAAQSMDRLKDKRAWVYDRPAPRITDVMRQARQWRHAYGIRALYVDYLQRIQSAGHGEVRHRVAYVVESLKELARELQIPVICLAQVRREVENRTDKRPGMADLKEAGEIEQEADSVITLYRDEVYHEDSPDKGTAELVVCKNRHGPTGVIRCVWRADYMRFEDYAVAI